MLTSSTDVKGFVQPSNGPGQFCLQISNQTASDSEFRGGHLGRAIGRQPLKFDVRVRHQEEHTDPRVFLEHGPENMHFCAREKNCLARDDSRAKQFAMPEDGSQFAGNAHARRW